MTQKGFFSVFALIVAFVMIAILATGVWYYFQYVGTARHGISTEAPSAGSLPTPTSKQEPDIPDGWQLYSDPVLGFTFIYPADAQIRTEGEYIGVSMLGPTQSEGTELYDGLSVLMAVYPLNSNTLQEAAETDQNETATDPVVHTISEVAPVTFGGKEGYKYTATSLGERDIIFLPFSSDLYIKVINGTVDPTNAGLGEKAEQIVASVKE